MRKVCLAASIWLLGIVGMAQPAIKLSDYKKLNRRAAKEYLQPIRPGYDGRNAFWNEFSVKFMYAPAFDFKAVDGAYAYLFTVKAGEQTLTFKAATPTSALNPVWNKVPAGKVLLTVQAVNAKGQVLQKVGEREFYRDYPFAGPYQGRVGDYHTAAVKALLFIHNMRDVRYWRDHTNPNADKDNLFDYICKIYGHVIRSEMLLAKLKPEMKEDAVAVAHNVAAYIMSQSQPADAVTAYFPPTYDELNGKIKRPKEHIGKTMMMEAVDVANAFFDIYDVTGERLYYDRAMGIVDTYRRMQRPDGSWPIKIDLQTGEPVNEVSATPHDILFLVRRLNQQYGITKYNDMRDKAERWMKEVQLVGFNLTGQFEDTSVLGLKPFENLTNCVAAPYAYYLLTKDVVTKEEAQSAEELTRFCEDQFTSWERIPEVFLDMNLYHTPSVVEQYSWRAVVDASVSNVANAFLGEFLHTGNKLWLAKALSLENQQTVVQNQLNGKIPTIWEVRYDLEFDRGTWVNCMYHSVVSLLRFSEATSSWDYKRMGIEFTYIY